MASCPIAYALIPPPPLPEFYLSKAAGKNNDEEDKQSTSPTSSFSDFEAIAATIVESPTPVKQRKKSKHKEGISEYTYYPGKRGTGKSCHVTVEEKPAPIPGDATYETMSYLPHNTAIRVVNVPATAQGYDVPPLAIYHICRICLRPRSSRYHASHPIPLNGMPPPPGICRRCRVKTVDDNKSSKTEVEFWKESNDIKIGIQPFLPGNEYISLEDMKEHKRRRFLDELDAERQREKEEGEEEEDGQQPYTLHKKISYRHIRTRSYSRSPTREKNTRKVELASRPKTSITSTSQDAINAVNNSEREVDISKVRVETDNVAVETSRKKERESKLTSSQLAEFDSFNASLSSIKASRQTVAKAAAGYRSMEDARPRPTSAESQIRKIAREEVEKYRQAERKIEAHKDPYAHGRMVPVEPKTAVEVDDRDTKRGRATRIVIEQNNDNHRSARPPKNDDPLNRQVRARDDSLERVRVRLTAREPDEPASQLPRSYRRQRIDEDDAPDCYSDEENEVRQDYSSNRRQQDLGPQWRQEPESNYRASSNRDGKSKYSTRGTADSRSRNRKDDYTLPDYEDPAGVKLRDVVGVAQEENDNWEESHRRTAWTSRRSDKHDVVEVIEEYDLPPDMPFGSEFHPNDHGTDGRSKPDSFGRNNDPRYEYSAQSSTSSSSSKQAQNAYSEWTDRDYWLDNGAVYTASGLSSKFGKPESRNRNREVAVSMPVPREYIPQYTHGESQYESKNSRQSAQATRRDDYSTGKSSAKSVRTDKASDGEYFYATRRTYPRSSDRSGWSQRETTERLYRQRRPAEPTKQDPTPRRRDNGQETDKVAGSDASRVRFASKVEFSPTPPGSDASSSQFRQFRGRPARGQIDGQISSEQENDNTGEYQHRGRVRSRASDDQRSRSYKSASLQDDASEQTIRGPRGSAHGSGYFSQANSRTEQDRPLARALSESPSRECLESIASGARSHDMGSYRSGRDRRPSTYAEDGSNAPRWGVDDRGGGSGGW